MSEVTSNREEPRPVRGFSFLDNARASGAHAWLLGIGCAILYLASILLLRWQAPYTDEIIHYAQIWLFAHDRWRVLADLTTIPGYHLLVAGLLDGSGSVSLQGARLINALFGLVAVAGFHALRTRLWPGTQTLASAQLLLLPILAPLFFLVYTDVLALALLLWALWACIGGRHWLAAILLTGVVFVRQHEVVWGGLLALVAIGENQWRVSLKQWRATLVRLLPYALPALVFLIFWAWNGSISLSRGQAALHPDFSFHGGNLLFALLVFTVLLPLQTAANFAAAWRRSGTRWWFVPGLLVIAVGFWLLFRADNPYNSAIPQLYLHNRIPQLLAQDGWVRAVAGLLAAMAVAALSSISLRPLRARWFFSLAALFLAASWLVELRYVMVPFVLWLALRESRGRLFEWITLAYWGGLSCGLMWAILTRRLFL